MTDMPRAVELPDGTVVADHAKTLTRQPPREPDMAGYCWQPGSWHHSHVDAMLAAGATVLRHGYGKDR